MSDLQGNAGELRATIHITRKATGKVETYELRGPATEEQARELGAQKVHGTAGGLIGESATLNGG